MFTFRILIINTHYEIHFLVELHGEIDQQEADDPGDSESVRHQR